MKIYRGHCEFKSCLCVDYTSRNKGLCSKCNHAECWHKIIYSKKSQFESPRPTARKPKYKIIRILIPDRIEPVVPPLPIHNFCPSVDDLPA